MVVDVESLGTSALPQELRPTLHYCGLFGTTEVMPCYKTPRSSAVGFSKVS
jgi:hypothetical protein